MKLTRSKDGEMRGTIRIDFRMSRADVEVAVAELIAARCELSRWEHDSLEVQLERRRIADGIWKKDVDEELRDMLYERGASLWVRSDDHDSGLQKVAAERVTELYPTIGGASLHEETGT